ncbi:hypothetical protein DPMN_007083, partial [Dreissena polymorpha]
MEIGIITTLSYNVMSTVAMLRLYKMQPQLLLANHGNSVECMPDGQWSNITFICKFNCGEPYVKHAQASFNSTFVGSQVTYTCNEGYVLQPQDANTSRFCIEPTFWSLQNFTCLANCSEPRSIDNATMAFNSTLQGSMVNYTCIEPTAVYQPDYPSDFYCNELRQWEPTTAYETISCELYCKTPPSKENANRPNSLVTFLNGTAKYSCNRGARFDTYPPNDTIVCERPTESNEWTQPNFECIRITYNEPCRNDSDCLDTNSFCYPTNTTYDNTSQDTERDLRCTCKPLYKFNQTTSTCQPISFETFDNETSNECFNSTGCSIENTMCVGKPNTDNGESSVCACKPGFVQGNYTLQCIPVNCGRPPDINNASVSVTSTSYGSLANYTCINADPREEYESQMQLRCLGEGLWYQQWEQQRFYCEVKCNYTLEIANGSYTGRWRHNPYTSHANIK